jgi:hypothetical protein
MNAMQLPCFETKQPSFKLKTRQKQILGSLPLYIMLSASGYRSLEFKMNTSIATHVCMYISVRVFVCVCVCVCAQKTTYT